MLRRNAQTTILIGTSLVVLFLLQGCGSGGVDVDIKNVTANAPSKDGLEPLERGKVRRQILNETEENIAIWLKGVSAEYDQAFSENLLAPYEKQLAKLRQEGRDKVRIHENQAFEVTELAKDAATVEYTFIDKSYFVSAATGKVVVPAKNSESEILISVVKEDGRWKIRALIGSGEATL
ncbi:MAG: hypothetical protein KGZ93_09130 [Actinobacteria bacterium]|nr:hypothetical protein [Actinomycetota bacterium]